jgi:transposase
MPPRYQRPYPPEFQREAVRLLETSGHSIPQVAAELGVSGESLRLWRRQEELDRGERGDGLTTDERDELRKLRRWLCDLEQRFTYVCERCATSCSRGTGRLSHAQKRIVMLLRAVEQWLYSSKVEAVSAPKELTEHVLPQR